MNFKGGRLRIGRNAQLYGEKLIFGSNVKIATNVSIFRNVTVGNNVNIGDNVEIRCNKKNRITIGNNCTINRNSMIMGNVVVGNYCLIAPNCKIIGSNHNFSDRKEFIKKQGISSKGIEIEDDVWLGANVVIVDGVTIGMGSVIGASSVVTKDIPPYSIAVGNPCRVIKKRN
ncbi:DapH/DapD/GlmU-related protein [Marinifilum sp. D714]|uniref:acyltransferase n=1 Tax=Marinifilum sp. D714 TaxID=2937523 RepID=UPI0027C187C0|nr:DapH/DapD/GlmU-related protein [Marinifilum sp. D714]MDQ2178551.1 hypothetical protein [Marinifilum sp. D714]